jgi:hypothetical protein
MRVSNHAGDVGLTSDRSPASPVVAVVRIIGVAGGVTGVAPGGKVQDIRDRSSEGRRGGPSMLG